MPIVGMVTECDKKLCVIYFGSLDDTVMIAL
jgi:hypothetical protein